MRISNSRIAPTSPKLNSIVTFRKYEAHIPILCNAIQYRYYLILPYPKFRSEYTIAPSRRATEAITDLEHDLEAQSVLSQELRGKAMHSAQPLSLRLRLYIQSLCQGLLFQVYNRKKSTTPSFVTANKLAFSRK